eukprot:XP_025000921.1 adenylate cyclase type 10-like [Gallus gallus]
MLSFMSVRGGDRQYFFVCSGALDEVVKAQKLSAAHEVVLSQTCWELCDQKRIRAKPLAGKGAVKVVGMRRLARREWKDAVVQLSSARGERHLKGTGLRRPTLRMCDDSELAARLEKYLSTAVLRKVWPPLLAAACREGRKQCGALGKMGSQKKVQSELREDVPLELCSELRPVTSLFVQLKFADRINAIELSSSLGDCSNTISGIISPHKGEINKTLLFDKGCTFLCVFGFPGEKLAHEITHALECAMQIFHMTSMGLRKLQLVSVGVSSGAAFCGFTGHPERFEHTALGFKVNLAARMMVAYPGVVSCDAETCAASRLPSYCFRALPKRNLKGVISPTTVYQYVGTTEKQQRDVGVAEERSPYGPLLGREAEIDRFEFCLEAYKHLEEPHVLAFVGIPGSGKSHLLAELAILGRTAGHSASRAGAAEAQGPRPALPVTRLQPPTGALSYTTSGKLGPLQDALGESRFPLQKGPGGSPIKHCCPGRLELPGGNSGSQRLLLLHRRVNAVELAEENLKQPFSAIRLLVARALGLQAGETCSDRQRALQTVLQGTIEESSYCLLNDVFLVEFPITDEVCRMRHTEWNSAFHLTCTQVLQKVLGGEFGIFFVDNAHFVDSESWSIMWPLLQSITVLMVMSLAPGHARAEDIFKAATDSTTSERITCLRLEGLKASDVVRKACQELGVRSIPRELARFLIQRSSGIPYYCEELLRSLRCNNMLLLHTGRPKEGEDSWQSLIAKASPAVTAASSPGTGSDGERMCAIRPDVSLETSMLPFALKGSGTGKTEMCCFFLAEIALAELDRMDLQKQMVLKFAAIIGPVFTTQQLVHILPISVNQWINPLLDMLVKDNILKWLKNTEEPEDVQGAPEGPATSGQAGSGVERPSVNTGSRKQQSDVLAFCAPLLWEATYELWPTRERVNIHRQCAAFLEKHAHKCQRCHGGDFVAFHRFGVSSPQKQGSCQGSADEDDCCSWEALVVAGEHLRRARTHPAEGEILAEGEQTTLRAEDGGECSCQCEAIAEAVLVPLARHYRAMGSTSQALYYVLECAAAYLHVSNSYMALMKLSEAEALRSSIKKEGNAIDRFEEAIFFSLKGEVKRQAKAEGVRRDAAIRFPCWQGMFLPQPAPGPFLQSLQVLGKSSTSACLPLPVQVCSNVGCVKLAKEMSRQALRLLEKRFPRTRAGAFVKSLWEGLKRAPQATGRASFLPQEAR